MASDGSALVFIEPGEATAMQMYEIGPAGRPGHETDDGFAIERAARCRVDVDEGCVELTKQDRNAYPGFQCCEDFDPRAARPMRGHVDAVVALEQAGIAIAVYDGPNTAHAIEVGSNHQHTATG